MTRNELNAALAAYEAANSAFEAAMRTYDAARDAYFAIPGKATAEQDAAFDAARAAYETAHQVYDAAFAIAAELPETADDDVTDDSADQLVLL